MQNNTNQLNDILKIRSENRYYYHPQGKKKCALCLTVYDNVSLNFDIHKTNKNGTYTYAGKCKICNGAIRRKRNEKYKTDINLYAKLLFSRVRCRAKSEHLDFNLTIEYLIELWNTQKGCCYYTGKLLDLSAKTTSKTHPHVDFPSLDKLYPQAGYIKGNVVWTTYGINRMKNEYNKDQFIEFCKIVSGRFV